MLSVPFRVHASAAAWVASALILVPAVSAGTLPDAFKLEPVVSEPFDSNPVSFAILPDGRPLIVEKNTGNVRLAAVGSSASVVILTLPSIAFTFEQGLIGIAVDPNWPQRPYVYFHATVGNFVANVVMYKASGDLTDPASTNLQLGSPYLLLADIPDLQGFHQAGTLRFGPDQRLYASLGDDGSPCEAQNRTILKGKILRLDVSAMPGVGTGPPSKSALVALDNPYATSTDENERLVYSYGLRNPFRFVIDPRTEDLYLADVGENSWEEVDRHRFSPRRGINFGWPEFEAGLQDPVPGSENCSTGPYAAPIFAYPHTSGAASVIVGPYYRVDAGAERAFPAAYDGSLFVCEFYSQWVRRLVRIGNDWADADSVPGQPSATSWAQDLGHISDMQQGRDGAIYFLNLMGGTGTGRGLYRIVPRLATDADLDPIGDGLVVHASPNPMRAGRGTTIQWRRSPSTPAQLHIYDAAGRLVRTLPVRPADPAGIFWNGRSQGGGAVAPGIYVFRIMSPAGELARGKISVVR